jgi:ABC-2 type transport system ATP-binding protein
METEGFALNICNVRKSYGDKAAVDGLNMSVRRGELYALLGPNGAGKTTTLRMVAGLLSPDSGDISVMGVNVKTDPIGAKRMLAWLPDEPMLYDRLTAWEYLEFMAGLWSVPSDIAHSRAEELLKLMSLWDNRNQQCQTFSRGMKQKAVLAGALIHDPQVLMLDEPLTGLDAPSSRMVKELLKQRTAAGKCVILTTHILDVAERMADRIGIIAAGKLLAEGRLEDLQLRSGETKGTLEDVFLSLTNTNDADAVE